MTHDLRDRVLAYRDPAVLHAAVMARGIAALVDEVNAAAYAFPDPAIQTVAHIVRLALNRPYPPESPPEAYAVQQVRDAAHHQSLDEWAAACDAWLAGRVHFAALPDSRWPVNASLIDSTEFDEWLHEWRALTDDRVVMWGWSSGQFILWSPAAARTPIVCAGHTGEIRDVRELPDGRLLSRADDGTVRLWTAEGAPLGLSEEGFPTGDEVSSEARYTLTLADSRLVTMGDEVRLWDAERAASIVLEAARKDHWFGVIALRSGRLVTWSWSDKVMRLWTPDGDLITVIEGHTAEIRTVHEMEDGAIVSLSSSNWEAINNDYYVRVWDADGQPIAALPIGSGYPECVPLSAGRLLIRIHDQDIRGKYSTERLTLWSIASAPRPALRVGHRHMARVHPLPDGRLLSWVDDPQSGDSTPRVWSSEGMPLPSSPENDALRRQFWRNEAATRSSRRLRDGRLLVITSDKTLEIRSADGETLLRLDGHIGRLTDAMQIGDGRLLSWASDGTMRFWTRDGAPISTMPCHPGACATWVMELDDGRLFSWGYDGRLCVYTPDGTLLAQYDPGTSIHIRSLVRDVGHIAFGGSEGQVMVVALRG